MSAESSQPPVVVQTSPEGVATIRIDRPGAMNALDTATKVALRDALQAAADDAAVRVVVLTGTGRAFCVGQDLREHVEGLRSGEGELSDTVTEHYNPIVELIATMDKPVVAAVNGVAAGAGAAFALAADFRVMVDTAGINLAFTGIALSCDSGSSWTLQRLVGPARAKELLFFPRTIPAAECLDLGLVTRVVTADDLDAAVAELTGPLAAGPTRAFGAVRRAVAFSSGRPLAESLAHEATLMSSTGGTADHATAVEAFLAKEKPVFTGR